MQTLFSEGLVSIFFLIFIRLVFLQIKMDFDVDEILLSSLDFAFAIIFLVRFVFIIVMDELYELFQ